MNSSAIKNIFGSISKFSPIHTVLYICGHPILGQLWNLVVLELTETETNYEAGFRELDKMEQTKIPVKVVSVLRRNMTTAEHKKVSGIKI